MAGETLNLVLDADEARLLRTALVLLEDTLGHDEADELRAVKALIRKLDAGASPSGRVGNR
jgi:hypothetical protein